MLYAPHGNAGRRRFEIDNRPWSTDDIDQLFELAANHSAREIGEILDRSRNSVIGKMFRLGLTLAVREERRARPKPVVVPAMPPEHIRAVATYLSGLCACGGTRQPGRDRCARCLHKAMPERKRAGTWGGLVDGAAMGRGGRRAAGND